MLIKTKDLIDDALDWAVSFALEKTQKGRDDVAWLPCLVSHFKPSRQWADGGPLIDQYKITTISCEKYTGDGFISLWFAELGGGHSPQCQRESENYDPQFEIDEDYGVYGPTALVAAMRSLVIHTIGHKVDVPDEVLQTGDNDD